MVKIRLTRTGRKNHAAYRLVAIDSRKARDSKALEFLGHYLPHEKEVKLETDRINYWLSVGAQPSDTVTRILVKEGILKKDALPTKKFSSKPGRKAQERNAKEEEAPASETDESKPEEATADQPEAKEEATEEK